MDNLIDTSTKTIEYEMKTLLLGLKGDFSKSSGLGIQRYMFELYKGLHELDKNISRREINPIKFIGNGLSFALKTFFMNFDSYQIVHNLGFVPEFLNYKPRRNYILITTAHDFLPILYPKFTFEHSVTLKDRLWRELVLKPGLSMTLSSDYIICNSSQTKQEAIKLGYDKDKAFVINLGVDNRFRKGIPEKEANNYFKVGYIGSLLHKKNLEFAISALNKLHDTKIYFDIQGKKELEYKYLMTIVKNKNVAFKGFAPEKELINIYDSFDVFVFPSLHEGFGLPILEAQARGLPVIIYKYGKIPKEVRKYCFEAESPEHMAQIIQNIKENGYNEKLRKKATEYARSFTWEKCAKETLKVYKKVVNW
ncbi:MAG: glycosyltransferase family 1 protein [Candidatus Micrarchaeaceae archaeon]